MSHPGNWHRNPRKMALEIERLRAWEERHWPKPPPPDPAIRLDLLRPCDTMRLGMETMTSCDDCRTLRVFVPPADTRKCNWAYVVQITRCACGAKVCSIQFSKFLTSTTPTSTPIGRVVRVA